jgi:glycosyltransferase involved in cell wall biosynthesis
MLSIHLTEAARGEYDIIWLVPTIDNKYNRFTYPRNRLTMKSPLFVEELQKRAIPFIEGNVSKYNILKNMILFRKIFREYDIDAVWTQFGFERFYATFFGKLLGRKTIWHERWYSLGTKFIFLKRIFYLLFVDCFIAVSAHIGLCLPQQKKIFVVHNGISVKPVQQLGREGKNSMKNKLGLGRFEHIVIMIAAFRDYKRHDLAMKIIEKVYGKSGAGVGFVFLGDGPLLGSFRKEVKGKKLDDFVITPGHKLNTSDYMLASDVMILTSHYGEGLPNCLLEGMNYKLPLVAFDMEWAGEIIKHGENGYLVNKKNCEDFADYIISLISDKDKKELMGMNGYRMLMENFDIILCQKKIMNVLKKVM